MLGMIGNDKAHALVSSEGGMVHEFVWEGSNIIAPYRTVGDGKARGGIPICFPYFGSPPEEMESFGKHGWLRRQDLKIVDESEMHVVYKGFNGPSKGYPWRLRYEVTITVLPETGLRIMLVTERMDDGRPSDAPINPGLHPYFCSDPSNPIAGCMARVGSKVITDFPLESERILVHDEIIIRSGQKYVNMALGGDFYRHSYLTLWSDKPEEYFCVEPILTNPQRFNKDGRFLKVGESSMLVFTLAAL